MRYVGPKCRLCRNSGVKLFLKGAKCESVKCPVVRRQVAPGQHSKRRFKLSDFGLHLKEKQKLKRIYLVSEAQLKNYFAKSLRSVGNTGQILLSYLERRFDNVLVRAGLAVSHSQARQLVKHKHFHLNGKVVDVPSVILKVGDKISYGKELTVLEVNPPAWVRLRTEANEIEIVGLPERSDVREEIDEQLVVEYYSR